MSNLVFTLSVPGLSEVSLPAYMDGTHCRPYLPQHLEKTSTALPFFIFLFNFFFFFLDPPQGLLAFFCFLLSLFVRLSIFFVFGLFICLFGFLVFCSFICLFPSVCFSAYRIICTWEMYGSETIINKSSKSNNGLKGINKTTQIPNTNYNVNIFDITDYIKIATFVIVFLSLQLS